MEDKAEIEMEADEIESLRESVAYLRKIFDSMNEGLVVHETETGAMIDANQRARDMYGFPEGSLAEINIERISEGEPPYSRHEAYTWIQKARIYGPQVFEWSARRLDGTLFPAEVALRIERIAGKERVLASVRDISDRKSSEKALEESNARYQKLFNNLTSGFAIHEMLYDPQGNPSDYRYLEVNPAFEKLTGLKAGRVIGRTVREVIPEIEPHWIQSFGRVVKTGKPIRLENYVESIGIHVEAHAFRTAEHQFAVLFSDISERVQLEKTFERRLRDLPR